MSCFTLKACLADLLPFAVIFFLHYSFCLETEMEEMILDLIHFKTVLSIYFIFQLSYYIASIICDNKLKYYLFSGISLLSLAHFQLSFLQYLVVQAKLQWVLVVIYSFQNYSYFQLPII